MYVLSGSRESSQCSKAFQGCPSTPLLCTAVTSRLSKTATRKNPANKLTHTHIYIYICFFIYPFIYSHECAQTPRGTRWHCMQAAKKREITQRCLAELSKRGQVYLISTRRQVYLQDILYIPHLGTGSTSNLSWLQPLPRLNHDSNSSMKVLGS